MPIQKVEADAEFLTVSVVARELQTSPATVRRWCKTGHLECVVHPVNRYRFVTRASVETLKSEIRMTFGMEAKT
jgi:predicted site-specific integrase-resolvase